MRLLPFCFFIICFFSLKAQTSIDKIIAQVGKEIILQSDLESAYSEYAAQFMVQDDDEEGRCFVFEHLLYTKLMLHQADVDSIVITEQQVEAALNMQINYYIQVGAGGDARLLERHFGKTIAEIKKDLREQVRDKMYVEEVQRKITQNINITPSEVKTYVNRIGVDSLPLIPITYEFGHILKTPVVSESEIAEIKNRLEGYREQILRDNNPANRFSTIARLYSDDGSAAKGGELGFVERGALYPEFEAVAFNLKSGEVSHIVKTRAGYHIILLHERRGESVKLSHILLQPKPSAEEQVSAIEFLDSVKQVILDQKIGFSDAALQFSDDPNKLSGGWVINPYSATTKFDPESLDPATFATLDKLIPEEYSSPIVYINEEGVLSYRLLYLKSKVAPHRANLVEDFDIIKNNALDEKRENAIEKWIKNKVKITSIKIDEKYNTCDCVIRWKIND